MGGGKKKCISGGGGGELEIILTPGPRRKGLKIAREKERSEGGSGGKKWRDRGVYRGRGVLFAKKKKRN